jgi:hypothetical protein
MGLVKQSVYGELARRQYAMTVKGPLRRSIGNKATFILPITILNWKMGGRMVSDVDRSCNNAFQLWSGSHTRIKDQGSRLR